MRDVMQIKKDVFIAPRAEPPPLFLLPNARNGAGIERHRTEAIHIWAIHRARRRRDIGRFNTPTKASSPPLLTNRRHKLAPRNEAAKALRQARSYSSKVRAGSALCFKMLCSACAANMPERIP